MHLRQPGFIYIACVQFAKNKERIQILLETGDLRLPDQNELDKVCFLYNISYRNFEGLTGRTVPERILYEKAVYVLKVQNKMTIRRFLLQRFITFLIIVLNWYC